jgi:hypothetical protein
MRSILLFANGLQTGSSDLSSRARPIDLANMGKGYWIGIGPAPNPVRGTRETLAQRCDSLDNKEVSASDRGRYCACLNKGVAALSDQELLESTQAATRNFDLTVKAIREGKPPPAKEPVAMEKVALACRKP